MLIAPEQLHAVFSSGSVAPSFITVPFETNLDHLESLTNKILQGNEEGRLLLIRLPRESRRRKPSSSRRAAILPGRWRCDPSFFSTPVAGQVQSPSQAGP